jgi:hypothetical protein
MISRYQAECACRALEFRYDPTHYHLTLTVIPEGEESFAVEVFFHEDAPFYRTLPREVNGVPVRFREWNR